MPDFSAFHFLRPQWLWALIPTAALFVVIRRGLDPERHWRRLIAPELLPYLRVSGGKRQLIRPIHFITLLLVLATLAAAGPAWEREVSPFTEDTAPLVVALDLSSSMNAVDVQPTRLERAKQKIRDLLAERPGARTALLVYAGTAHMVLPPSDDPTVFEAFLSDLGSDIMPVAGKDAVAALALADSLLARDSIPGSILFLTDGISADYASAFQEHRDRSSSEVMILAIGTSKGGPIRTGPNQFATDARGRLVTATMDKAGLEAVSANGAAFLVGATVDDADVSRLQRRVQTHMTRVQQEDATARWRDEGYWLVIPLVLMGMLWYRKGWTVRWDLAVLVMMLAGCADSGSFQFVDLWLTPDQQGRRLFENGRYAEAAARFEDSRWKGTAYYHAGDLDNALTQFSMGDTPESSFNIGNTYALLGSYPEAIANYDAALAERPDWIEAQENRALVVSLIPPDEEPQESGEAAPPPTFDPDEIREDNKADQGEQGEVQLQQLSDEQLSEMWLRRLQTTPADFLRQRFAVEALGQ